MKPTFTPELCPRCANHLQQRLTRRRALGWMVGGLGLGVGVVGMSPMVGVLGTVAGLVVAHRVNLPPGQTIVALLGGTLVWVWGVRHLLSFLGRQSHGSAPPAASVPVAAGLSLSVEDSALSLTGLAGTGSCLGTGFRHGES